MTKDPEEINDPDRAADQALKDLIWKMGQSYAGRNARSRTENEGRKKEREGMEAQDIDPNAFATVVRLVKAKSPRELKRWVDSFKLCMAVLGKAQADLFPEDAVRAQKREDDRKAKEKAARDAARTPTELDAASDANPRSDPKSGGAGKKRGRKPKTAKEAAGAAAAEGDAMIKSAAEAIQQQNNPDEIKADNHDPLVDEQAEGASVLDSLMPDTKSQSQEAEERRRAAGLS